MRKQNQIVAILCSDLHLSLKPPTWRSAEPDWFGAMARPLDEISGLQHEHKCPVLCAGDVFDRWNSPPELINFAMDYLPDNFWAIPGQHDLPYHSYDDIKKSAYWTLVRTNLIKYMHPETPTAISDTNKNIVSMGYPWGYEVKPLGPQQEGTLRIAVLHEYNWIPGKEYPSAPTTSKLSGKRKNFKGWDIVCIGDNHKGFMRRIGKTTFFNCGSMMRRKSDEKDYKPWVGLVTKQGEVIPHYLDTSKDKHIKQTNVNLNDTKDGIDMDGFLQGLEDLGKDALDFKVAMKHYLHKHKTSKAVRSIIKGAMNNEL